jgi:hypothetical protein
MSVEPSTENQRAAGVVLHRLVRPITLFLVLTHRWYDETESGAKRTEYRAMTERWKRQIWERRDRIAAVRFSRGYTSRTLTRSVESIDIGPCPIPGWAGDYYRIHFSHA